MDLQCTPDSTTSETASYESIFGGTCMYNFPSAPSLEDPRHRACQCQPRSISHLENFFCRVLLILKQRSFKTDAHWGLWCRSMSCGGLPRRTLGRWWRRWWWQRGGEERCWPEGQWLWQWQTSPPVDLWKKVWKYKVFPSRQKQKELFKNSFRFRA